MHTFLIISCFAAYLVYLLAWWLKGRLSPAEVLATLIVTAILFATGMIFDELHYLWIALAFYAAGSCLGLIRYLQKPRQFDLVGQVIHKSEDEDKPEFFLMDKNGQERRFVLKDVYRQSKVGDEIRMVYEKSISDKVYLIDVTDADGHSLLTDFRAINRIRGKYRRLSQTFLMISLFIMMLALIFFFQAI